MKKILILIFFNFFLISCSNKKEIIFTKNTIEFTKKVDILENDKINLIFWATYLNKIEYTDFEDEIFIVSIYFPNKQINNDFSFFLNNEKSIKVEEVKKDNKKYQYLIRKNPWGLNYLVKFNKSSNKSKKNILKLKTKTLEALISFSN